MVDINEEVLEKAMERLQKSLVRVASRKFKEEPAAAEAYLASTLGNLQTSTDIEQACPESLAYLVLSAGGFFPKPMRKAFCIPALLPFSWRIVFIIVGLSFPASHTFVLYSAAV